MNAVALPETPGTPGTPATPAAPGGRRGPVVAPVAWLLARPGSAGRASLVLPVVAFGVVTTLLLGVVGGAQTFWSWRDDTGIVYQALAVIALVLLLVPLVSLGGAAARLSARRRDDRLATLRLLGATPGTVAAITVIESAVVAAIGALAGLVGYVVLLPGLAAIRFRDEALGFTGVLLPWWLIAGILVGVVLLAAASAAIGLRRVVISPLGVRTRQEPPRVHWVRALVAVLVVAAAFALMNSLGVAPAAIVVIAMLGVAFGGALAVVNLVGPWIVRLIARGQARRAKTPERLLAARTVLDAPKDAWRQVSGVAMTSFMAVFAGTGVAIIDAMSGEALDAESLQLVTDIRTGLLITVIGSFLMVACSVGVNQAAGILDRAPLYRSLDMLGMPVRTMDAARRRAVMSPLRIASIGSAIIAAVLVLPLTGIALLTAPLTLVVVAVVLAAGILLVWCGLAATAPILSRAATPEAGARDAD